ncbi:hypothetical protein GW17_00029156 [Ensete ventricosum]|nr:hypothetical protein GW17_00029156 [Ensete ventricosum]
MVNLIPNCCSWKQGGKVYVQSCYLRFESYLLLQPLRRGGSTVSEQQDGQRYHFGLAKLFDVDETQKNTSRIAGTYTVCKILSFLPCHSSTANADISSHLMLVPFVVDGSGYMAPEYDLRGRFSTNSGDLDWSTEQRLRRI